MTATCLLYGLLTATEFVPNYDEAKVPAYTLPDPLVGADGRPVTTAAQWPARRAEILEQLKREMFGQLPGRPAALRWRILEEGPAYDGQALRRQIRIDFTDQPDGPGMELLLYLPAQATGPAPVFLGLNFQGNHTIGPDPAVRLSTSWIRASYPGVKDNRATEASRNAAVRRWPVPLIVSRGYGLATAYYGDLDPDFDDGFKNGVHALYPELQGRGDNFTAIGAWAWGLSRALDYLETDPGVDARRVAVMGHSRLGKTSLWAGATDERFALVISNDSGCGGAALSKRAYGETVARINTSFPHWFCANFKRYNNNEAALPFDQHFLLALTAPRPLYVASAEEDKWADPKGEFLAAKAAEPVWRLLGREGLPAAEWPPVNTPSHGGLGYHVRTGKHDVTTYDWEQYLAFADRHLTVPTAGPRVARASRPR